MRIDSHQHFTPQYRPELLFPILKRNRFDGSVLVTKLQTVEDTRWLLELAAEHAFIQGVVGWADLADARAGHLLDEYQRHPKFLGVCYSFDGELPADGALAAGLAELERRDLTLDLPPSLESVPRIAERFPGLRIAIDHLGRLSLAAYAFDRWARDLERAALYPQVFGKLSGFITDAPTQWKAEQFRPYALHALSAFGPARLMYGSDWPSYLPTGNLERGAGGLHPIRGRADAGRPRAVAGSDGAALLPAGRRGG